MKVALVQLGIDDNKNKAEKIQEVEGLIESLESPDMIVLPELWNVGFYQMDQFKDQSEVVGGETTVALSDLARKKKSYIFSGSFIEKDGDTLYNTALLLDRSGNIVAQYRKIHLFSIERRYVTRGDKLAVADTEFGKIGLSNCYDIRFPEMYRSMIDQGAEMFVNCAAWGYPRVEHFNLLNQVRAFENQAYWLMCSCAGSSGGNALIGRSVILDPWGTVVRACDEKPGVCEASINPEETKNARDIFPVVQDIVDFE